MAELIERRAAIAFQLHFAERLHLGLAQIVALSVEMQQVEKAIDKLESEEVQ